jgi:bifunctional non-homologous end joining protein LigD
VRSAETARKPGRKDRTDKGLPGAVKALLPAKMDPQLATLATECRRRATAYEIKFDGYRLMTRIQGGKATW